MADRRPHEPAPGPREPLTGGAGRGGPGPAVWRVAPHARTRSGAGVVSPVMGKLFCQLGSRGWVDPVHRVVVQWTRRGRGLTLGGEGALLGSVLASTNGEGEGNEGEVAVAAK